MREPQTRDLRHTAEQLLASGVSMRVLGAVTRTSQARLQAFLDGDRALDNPHLRSGLRDARRKIQPACALLRRTDILELRGMTVADIEVASDGLVTAEVIEEARRTGETTRAARAGAICAIRRLRTPRDAAIAAAARSRGAVRAMRWRPGDLDDPHAEPMPDVCAREQGQKFCDCSPACLDASKRQSKRQKLSPRRASLIPAAPAIKHLRRLLGQGFTRQDIAASAGVPESTVKSLQRTSTVSRTIHPDTARRILAVQRADPREDDTARVLAIPTARRVEALNVIGWSPQAIDDALGISAAGKAGRREKITASSARAISEFFEAHHRTEGPSSRCRIRARNRGLLPWAVWDDIDDITEVPQIGAISDPSWRAAARDRWAARNPS